MLNLDNYKTEDMVLMNEKMVMTNQSHTNGRGGNFIFECERSFTEQQKLEFCDRMLDNKPSQLIAVIEKFQEDKKTLPQSSSGTIKTVSLKAWINKNSNNLLTLWYDGEIGVNPLKDVKLTTIYYNQHNFTTICPKTEYRHNIEWTGEHLVNQIFHELLEHLKTQEIAYFRSIDTFELKLSELKNVSSKIGTVFNCDRLNMFLWNGREQVKKQNITESDLDKWIQIYKDLQNVIDSMSKDL